MARAVSPARHTCAFCTAIQRLAIRRRDLTLLAPAERVTAEHLAADTEPAAFLRRPRGRPARSALRVPARLLRARGTVPPRAVAARRPGPGRRYEHAVGRDARERARELRAIRAPADRPADFRGAPGEAGGWRTA